MFPDRYLYLYSIQHWDFKFMEHIWKYAGGRWEDPLLTVMNENGLLLSESFDLFEILSIYRTKLVSKKVRSSSGLIVTGVSNQDTISEECKNLY